MNKTETTNSPLQLLMKQGDCFADSEQCDILFFYGRTREPVDDELIALVKRRNRRSNLLLMLDTGGGSPDCAYRVVRFLQEHYDQGHGRITVFVDRYCKSAGTLMALGADEIVMSDGAELGPLDIQALEKDEIAEYGSGLKASTAITSVRSAAIQTYEECFNHLRLGRRHRFPTKLASRVATDIAVGLSKSLARQIDPMRLAEMARAMAIMEQYACRISTNNVKDRTISKLVAQYPDHGFVIDRQETALLFHNVRPPTEAEAFLALLANAALPELQASSSGETTIRFLCSPVETPDGSEPEETQAEESHGGSGNEPTVTTDAKGDSTIELKDGSATPTLRDGDDVSSSKNGTPEDLGAVPT